MFIDFYGNAKTPFLLNATVKYHLKSFPNTEVIEELKEILYVDDWLSGRTVLKKLLISSKKLRVFWH